MLTLCRRRSRSRSSFIPSTSSPSINTSPAVASISRVTVRIRVDFPLPDSPMTTNTSPGATSNETSRTAATQPVFSSSSARGSSASGESTMRSAFGP